MAGPFGGNEDLDPFFDTGEFAETVTISTSGGDIAPAGVFEAAFDDQVGIESSVDTFACPESDAPGVRHGDTLTRDDASTYKVAGVEPDGTGLVVLRLHRS